MKPLNTAGVKLIIKEVTQWAAHRTDIVAAALVGLNIDEF